jgi:hypothetical protein
LIRVILASNIFNLYDPNPGFPPITALEGVARHHAANIANSACIPCRVHAFSNPATFAVILASSSLA